MRILIRGGRPPHDTTSNEAAVGWRGTGSFATNIGNMLFADSVYRTLNVPGADLECDAHAPEWRQFTAAESADINENYDAYVLPMANAFRATFAEKNLPRMTALIENLTIPVVVVGVGAQMDLDGRNAQVSEAGRANTTAFVRAVLERSASIGVRGEMTRDLLVSFGLPGDRIDVIGCPSIYINSRDFAVTRKVDALGPDARLTMSLEGADNGKGDADTMTGLGDIWRANERSYADLTAVYQTLAGVELILWGEPAQGCPPGTPQTVHDAAYREDRLRTFTHPRTWREYLQDRDFVFGVRIHGNIAAVTAGTPAVMLSSDSRTKELADYHGIPQISLRTLVASGRYLAQDLYESADVDAMNRAMPQAWDRYHAFLERNGLQHIHQPGFANPDYDRQLAHLHLPPPIRPISAADPEGLATRIRWIRQGRWGDHHRPHGGYRPSFELDATDVKSPAGLVRGLRAETTAAQRKSEEQVAKLAAEVAQLRAEVEQLRSRGLGRS